MTKAELIAALQVLDTPDEAQVLVDQSNELVRYSAIADISITNRGHAVIVLRA